jgi:hypothetical protein
VCLRPWPLTTKFENTISESRIWNFARHVGGKGPANPPPGVM